MRDGEIGVVTADGTTLSETAKVETAPDHEVILSPAPHPYFTIKELLEQPEAIARALSFGARFTGVRVKLGGLDTHKEVLSKIHNLLITGCGTSKIASDFGAKVMRDLDCFDTVTVMDSAEVTEFSKYFTRNG